jgi:uncharacterized protein (TIGR03435 family)
MAANKLNSKPKAQFALTGGVLIALLALMCVVTVPASRAQSPSQNVSSPQKTADYEYDIVSIKPTDPDYDQTGNKIPIGIVYSADGFDAKSMRMWGLIINAFGVQTLSVVGAPKWWDTERFNIVAKTDGATADAMQKLPVEQLKLVRQRMLQKILTERFGLTFHHETKDMPCYVMTIGKGGSKLQQYSPDHAKPNDLQDFEGNRAANRFIIIGDELIGQSVTIGNFIAQLSLSLESPIVDKTGLTGAYDFRFKYFIDFLAMPPSGPGNGGQPAIVRVDTKTPIIEAIQKNLGLKLESVKGPVELTVIDHSARPSEN